MQPFTIWRIYASNDEIQKVLGETFKDIVNNIYQDQEVTNAINQYTN